MVIQIIVDGRSNIYRGVNKLLYGDYIRGFTLMARYSKSGQLYKLKGKERTLLRRFGQ